jgi:hypothetical protein
VEAVLHRANALLGKPFGLFRKVFTQVATAIPVEGKRTRQNNGSIALVVTAYQPGTSKLPNHYKQAKALRPVSGVGPFS